MNIGYIYTIRSFQTPLYYIGSTKSPLYKRFHKHNADYKYKINYPDSKCYLTSFEIIKHGDAYIELLEEFKYNNKIELHKREGELIRLHKNDIVNIIINGRTIDEYKKDNRDIILKKGRDYKKSRYALDAPKKKEYMELNKEKYNEYKKEYRIKNKDKINEYKNIRINCECGSNYLQPSKSVHNKSIKHLNFITNLMQPQLSLV